MNNMNRREALGAMLAGSAAALASPRLHSAETQSTQGHPNIVFILADDLGYGDVGCYGQQRILTPRLDEMARQGMRFTQAYAGSTVCAPSRCALMTGMHMGHAYIRGNASMTQKERVPLRSEDLTVAEVLKQAGYATGLIGKWGLGENGTTGAPNRKGFDEFFGYTDQRLAHNYFPDKLWRNEEEVAVAGNVIGTPNVCDQCGTYSHDLFTEEALSFIDRHQSEPFFLYLAYTLPHVNNEASRVREHGMEIPSTAPYSDQPWPEAQRSHAAMITLLDRDVGRLLDALEARGLSKNTLVVFTSDNGPHKEGGADPNFFNSSGPLRGIKRDLYEGGIRVPAIAWQPGVIAPGAVSDHVWAFWDMLPTLATLAGAPLPECDGLSLVPTLLGQPDQQQRHNHLYWEFHEGACKQAVRMDQWKAVRNGRNAPIELYNLDADLGESTDIAADHPELIARAEALFQESRTPSEHWILPE